MDSGQGPRELQGQEQKSQTLQPRPRGAECWVGHKSHPLIFDKYHLDIAPVQQSTVVRGRFHVRSRSFVFGYGNSLGLLQLQICLQQTRDSNTYPRVAGRAPTVPATPGECQAGWPQDSRASMQLMEGSWTGQLCCLSSSITLRKQPVSGTHGHPCG